MSKYDHLKKALEHPEDYVLLERGDGSYWLMFLTNPSHTPRAEMVDRVHFASGDLQLAVFLAQFPLPVITVPARK